MHGTGGSGICKYPDPFQMFGILKFKIRSQIHKKKISVPFCPNISGQNGSVLGSSGNFKSDKTERIFG